MLRSGLDRKTGDPTLNRIVEPTSDVFRLAVILHSAVFLIDLVDILVGVSARRFLCSGRARHQVRRTFTALP